MSAPAPHEIHLKETLLAVHEPERAAQIEATFGNDRRDAERVPFDRDRFGQPSEGDLAIDIRKTCSHQVNRENRSECNCEHEEKHESPHPFHML